MKLRTKRNSSLHPEAIAAPIIHTVETLKHKYVRTGFQRERNMNYLGEKARDSKKKKKC